MSVESATTINQLVTTNPLDADPVREGKAHIRLIKSTLLATLPAVTGVVTATHTELNGVIGLPARVTAVESGRVLTTGAQTITGTLNVTGVISQNGSPLVPSGTVVAWYGSILSPPGGWLVCDGTLGTPDLRDRFIIGAGSSLTLASVVGSNSISTTAAAAGGHSHGGLTVAAGGHTHVANSATSGAHSHGGATSGTVLTQAQLPAHTHDVNDIVEVYAGGGVQGGSGLTAGYGGVTSTSVGSNESHSHPIPTEAAHAHTIVVDAVADHAHVITAEGTHTHAVTFDNRPASYALVFIIKI